MLGWEYPPNISGGLGVACQGLAEALKDEGVEITFVIPRLTGKENKLGVMLVSASDIEMKEEVTPKSPLTPATGAQDPGFAQALVSKIIAIDSSLSPYNLAQVDGELTAFGHWTNIFFEEPKNGAGAATEPGPKTGSQKMSSKREQLQGGYGPGLLDEVARYASVVEHLTKNITFDLIHAHDWMTFPAAMAVREATGKPLVIHFHATEYDRAGESGSREVYDIEKKAIDKSDAIVTVSKWTSRVIASRYGAKESKIHVVHNGIIKNGNAPVRQRSPVANTIVTFLGRITFQKGPEYFVGAAKKVLAKFPDCHFVMAGSGDALPRIMNMVAREGLSSHIHFTGFLNKEEIERLLGMSSVYVMPSVSEPFGITPLEAVQAGVPVVVSKQSGVSEVLDHVLKVDFWNTDELADAICALTQYKGLAEMLRSNAKKNIETISWQVAAKKTKHVYHETLTQR